MIIDKSDFDYMFQSIYTPIISNIQNSLGKGSGWNYKRIIKAAKYFAKRVDFKDIKFPVKTRDIHKIENKNPSASAFLVMALRKNIQFMYHKNYVKKNMLTYY